MKEINKGAEAIILLDGKKIIKKRISKSYRDPVLDNRIIKTRNKQKIYTAKKSKSFWSKYSDCFFSNKRHHCYGKTR